MPKPTILFVDDEIRIHDAIRRSFRPFAGQWDMVFAENGIQALALMRDRPVSVVVTDIAMPGMDGAALVRELHEAYPEMPVIVLSGHWSPAMSSEHFGPLVRFRSKPVAAQDLAADIAAAIAEHNLAGIAFRRADQPGEQETQRSFAASDGSWVEALRQD